MRRSDGFVLYAAVALGVILARSSLAQSPSNEKNAAVPTTVFDCAEVSVDYRDDPSLTRDEKLALMDQALLKSLSKFDDCQRSRAKAGADANNMGGGTGANGAGQKGSMTANVGGSVAASDMTGEEKPKTEEGGSGPSSNVAWSSPKDQNEGKKIDLPKELPGTPGQPASAGNGKMPEDIPPADNDSVLEAQIRQAAINETDPDTKAKLWNEYRKYKGLPPRNGRDAK